MSEVHETLTLRERVEARLQKFKETPESVGHELRLHLSSLLCRHLSIKGWTQKRLADEAGMQESFVSRVMNADSNCTFDVAGRLLFALGLRADDVAIQETIVASASTQVPYSILMTIDSESLHHGQIFQAHEEDFYGATGFKAAGGLTRIEGNVHWRSGPLDKPGHSVDLDRSYDLVGAT